MKLTSFQKEGTVLGKLMIPKDKINPLLLLESIKNYCGTIKINVKQHEIEGQQYFVVTLNVDQDTINRILKFINDNN